MKSELGSAGTGFQTTSISHRVQPASAIVLAFGLALAVLSEGQVPDVWTKILLGAMIVPTVITALWLTASRSGAECEDHLGPRAA